MCGDVNIGEKAITHALPVHSFRMIWNGISVRFPITIIAKQKERKPEAPMAFRMILDKVLERCG